MVGAYLIAIAVTIEAFFWYALLSVILVNKEHCTIAQGFHNFKQYNTALWVFLVHTLRGFPGVARGPRLRLPCLSVLYDFSIL